MSQRCFVERLRYHDALLSQVLEAFKSSFAAGHNCHAEYIQDRPHSLVVSKTVLKNTHGLYAMSMWQRVVLLQLCSVRRQVQRSAWWTAAWLPQSSRSQPGSPRQRCRQDLASAGHLATMQCASPVWASACSAPLPLLPNMRNRRMD